MSNALLILKQIIVMFIYIAIGFMAFKTKILRKEGSKNLSALLVKIIMPCTIIKTFFIERTPEQARNIAIALLIAGFVQVTAILVSNLLFAKKNPIDAFATAYSNATFVGFPLIEATLGSGALIYNSCLAVFINLGQASVGKAMLAGNNKYVKLKAIVTSPLILACVSGVLVFFLQIPIPGLLNQCIVNMGNCTTPLAMILIGTYLAETNIKAFANPHIYLVCAVRLILIPAIFIVLYKLIPLGIDSTILKSIIIGESVAIGSNVSIYAQQLDKDYAYATELVCVSTILCIVTVPVLMFFI